MTTLENFYCRKNFPAVKHIKSGGEYSKLSNLAVLNEKNRAFTFERAENLLFKNIRNESLK